MSNKAQDHVHRLIRSMTSAEKRYFKLYASRHKAGKGANNLRMFDAIAGMAQYDERALLKRFAGAGFTRSFPIAKRRLFETLLNSLHAFHATSSIDARLHRMLHHVEILHDRGLYDDALKMLNSVRKLARAHDRQPVLLAVMDLERRAMERINYDDVDEDAPGRAVAEAALVHQEMLEVGSLWHLKSRLFQLLYRHGKPRDARLLTEVGELVRHPLLRDARVLRTARARFLFDHVHSAAAFAVGDLIRCEKHLEANQLELERSGDLLGDEPNLLLSVLSNRIHVLARLGRFDQASALLNEFERSPGRLARGSTIDFEVKVFATSASLELSLLAQRGEFKKGLLRAPAIEDGLAHHERRLSPLRKEGLCFQLAYLYFGAGAYAQALRWSNRQMNEAGPDRHGDLHAFGRMLNLLIHLELGKQDLLPYALRNAMRTLRKRRQAHRFELAFFRFVRERSRARTTQAVKNALTAFREAIAPLERDPLERSVFDHFDPLAWIDARLSGRAFDVVVQERARSLATAA